MDSEVKRKCNCNAKTLTWNVLDLGISYFNARQNADRALIAQERRRKAIHNLVRETHRVWWRAVAAQLLRQRVATGVAQADRALASLQAATSAGARNEVETLRLRKALLETLRQLESIDQELRLAKTQLAALTNLPPGAEIRLALPAGEMLPPTLDLSVARMEELAFENNPDIREQAYLSRIAVQETTKVLLQMLPGINLDTGLNQDLNHFLLNKHWYSYGARLTSNLFNILSAPDRLARAEDTKSLAEARRLAIRMSVLGQVHVAWAQYLNARQQLRRADALWQAESGLERHSLAQQRADAMSEVERVQIQTAAIAAELRRYQVLGEVWVAHAMIEATLGKDKAWHVAALAPESPAAAAAEPHETVR